MAPKRKAAAAAENLIAIIGSASGDGGDGGSGAAGAAGSVSPPALSKRIRPRINYDETAAAAKVFGDLTPTATATPTDTKDDPTYSDSDGDASPATPVAVVRPTKRVRTQAKSAHDGFDDDELRRALAASKRETQKNARSKPDKQPPTDAAPGAGTDMTAAIAPVSPILSASDSKSATAKSAAPKQPKPAVPHIDPKAPAYLYYQCTERQLRDRMEVWRERKSMSQTALAQATGMSISFLNLWIHEKRTAAAPPGKMKSIADWLYQSDCDFVSQLQRAISASLSPSAASDTAPAAAAAAASGDAPVPPRSPTGRPIDIELHRPVIQKAGISFDEYRKWCDVSTFPVLDRPPIDDKLWPVCTELLDETSTLRLRLISPDLLYLCCIAPD